MRKCSLCVCLVTSAHRTRRPILCERAFAQWCVCMNACLFVCAWHGYVPCFNEYMFCVCKHLQSFINTDDFTFMWADTQLTNELPCRCSEWSTTSMPNWAQSAKMIRCVWRFILSSHLHWVFRSQFPLFNGSTSHVCTKLLQPAHVACRSRADFCWSGTKTSCFTIRTANRWAVILNLFRWLLWLVAYRKRIIAFNLVHEYNAPLTDASFFFPLYFCSFCAHSMYGRSQKSAWTTLATLCRCTSQRPRCVSDQCLRVNFWVPGFYMRSSNALLCAADWFVSTS